MKLIDLIRKRNARIGIIGLGYVGLPLVVEFSSAGFDVTGFDLDSTKVRKLRRGISYIGHIPSSKIRECVKKGKFTPTDDFSLIREVDCIIICVPTPLNEHREPDLSLLVSTTRTVAGQLRKGQLVILESTTYPGTTDEVMRPILEEGG